MMIIRCQDGNIVNTANVMLLGMAISADRTSTAVIAQPGMLVLGEYKTSEKADAVLRELETWLCGAPDRPRTESVPAIFKSDPPSEHPNLFIMPEDSLVVTASALAAQGLELIQ